MCRKTIIISLIFIVFVSVACHQYDYTPKPSGYIRIDLPEKSYKVFKEKFPYNFEYPVYGKIKPDNDKNAEPYWINIEFPEYKGKIHLSYKKINGNLSGYIEDTRKLAYKHTIKAESIDEILINRDSSKVYGILYDIKGNTASSVQFFVTDSSKNFLRGALYFDAQPNKDSLAPLIIFFRKDVEHFLNTIKWQ